MDFGFGAFLEKIEQHFGPRVLKVLLVLMGVAVAMVCSKLIWETALGPLVVLVSGALAKGSLFEAAVEVFWIAAAFVAGIAIAGLIFANMTSWLLVRRGQALMRRTIEMQDKAAKSMELTCEHLAKAGKLLEAARSIADEAGAMPKESDKKLR